MLEKKKKKLKYYFILSSVTYLFLLNTTQINTMNENFVRNEPKRLSFRTTIIQYNQTDNLGPFLQSQTEVFTTSF